MKKWLIFLSIFACPLANAYDDLIFSVQSKPNSRPVLQFRYAIFSHSDSVSPKEADLVPEIVNDYLELLDQSKRVLAIYKIRSRFNLERVEAETHTKSISSKTVMVPVPLKMPFYFAKLKKGTELLDELDVIPTIIARYVERAKVISKKQNAFEIDEAKLNSAFSSLSSGKSNSTKSRFTDAFSCKKTASPKICEKEIGGWKVIDSVYFK